MKTKFIVASILFAFLSIMVIGQEANDIETKKTIEANPSNYINQGGVLPDKRETKESQEKKPEFIIHKSTSETEGERKVQYKTLEELNKYHDQTSPEYKLLKEQWIKENQSLYEKNNPEVPAEKTMSPEDRKKEFNSTH